MWKRIKTLQYGTKTLNGDKAVSNLEQNEDSGVWNEDITEETTRGAQICDVACGDSSGGTIEQSDQREPLYSPI